VSVRLSALVLLLVLALGSGPPGRPAPAVVFVSRNPIPGEPGAIPGLGPHHRAAVTGGRLMIREASGRIHPLLPGGALHDVSDPAVSLDGRRVAFAGTPHPDSAWRIYVARLDGGGLRAVTRSGSAGPSARFDDLDPCWISDSLLCFASTREGGVAEYASVPVTNLYLVRADGGRITRLTAERNGAEEPAFDPGTGRLVYARWWYNRHLPSALGPRGITLDPRRALASDRPNLWQVVELSRNEGVKLAAGDIGSRRTTTAYQPAFTGGTEIVGVYAANLGLSPRPGPTGIQAFAGRLGPARRLAGPIMDSGGGSYGSPRGLASPSACSPARLPDGRIVFAYDPGGRGDFGIFTMNADGSRITPLADFPGTLELDPAPVVPRTPSRGAGAWLADLARRPGDPKDPSTFTFLCENVFAGGPIDGPSPSGPAPAPGLVLRFFAVAPAMAPAHGDSAFLIREAPVEPDGAIRAGGLPAGRPMFEQLVDAGGRPVSTGAGPAHVAGFNFGAPGGTTRCVGCHLGHSVLPLGRPEGRRWFDASPGARVTATSAAPGTAGAHAAVDRRTRGRTREVAWIAGGNQGERLGLGWALPLEIREAVLYAPRPDSREGSSLEVLSCEVVLFDGSREVARCRAGPLSPRGTRVRIAAPRADSLEVRILGAKGAFEGHRAAGLAEVETIARLAASGPDRAFGSLRP